MITEITETTYKLDGELIDLEDLRRRAMNVGHAGLIHHCMGLVGYLYRVKELYVRYTRNAEVFDQRFADTARAKYKELIIHLNNATKYPSNYL